MKVEFKFPLANYLINLDDFIVGYPRQHTMVFARKRKYSDNRTEFIIIGFAGDKIYHCNIAVDHLNLNDDLSYEEIISVTFKA